MTLKENERLARVEERTTIILSEVRDIKHSISGGQESFIAALNTIDDKVARNAKDIASMKVIVTLVTVGLTTAIGVLVSKVIG